jgi:predicted permease
VWEDFRAAGRGLRQSRGYTATAVVILSVGLGLSTSVYSIVDGVLRRPLPYPDSQRLVMIWDVPDDDPGRPTVVAPGNVPDWQAQAQSLEAIAIFNVSSLALDTADGPLRVPGAVVSGNYFDVLQVSPALGRAFRSADDTPGAPPVIVLSHGFWQSRFGADGRLIGRRISFEGAEFLVAGVMPRGFQGPEEHFFGRSDYWITFREHLGSGGRGSRYLRTVARLRPDRSLEQARVELASISRRLAETHPATNGKWRSTVVRLQDQIVRDARPALLLLAAAVALVHLAACANLATLVLARGVGRQVDYGIRAALGATPQRLMQMVGIEGLLLALVGGVGGLLVAAWAVSGVVVLAPFLPRTAAIAIDYRVAGFALALACATGLIFSIAPGWTASVINPGAALKGAGRAGTEGPHRLWLRRTLVVAEVAVSFVLLIGASLLGRSFAALMAVSPGFSSPQVLTARIDLRARTESFDRELTAILERLEATAGVTAVGFTSTLPLYGLNNAGFTVEAATPLGTRRLDLRYRAVTPGYFPAMGIRLVHGRLLTEQDGVAAAGAVVINDVAARQLGDGAVGSRVAFDFADRSFRGTVVGVVEGVRHDDLLTSPEAEFYVPYSQHPVMGTVFMAARFSTPPERQAASVRSAVHMASPRTIVDEVRPLAELVAGKVAPQRLNMVLIGILSSTALLLAGVALYAVVSHDVNQRSREIGIRLALGGPPSEVLWLVLGRGLALALAGVILGGVAAYWSSRTLARLLFGIGPHDPVSFALSPLVIVAIAAVASYLPARRASRVDPLLALRVE